MKSIVLFLAVALASPLFAQDQRVPRPRMVTPPVHRGDLPADPPTEALERNITVRLDGTTTTGNEIDLSLTGIGPVLSAAQLVGDELSHLTCEYSITPAGAAYRVKYTISVRQKVPTSVSKDVTNFEYMNVTIQGTALCQPGKPVEIVRNAAKPLRLTVSPESEGNEE